MKVSKKQQKFCKFLTNLMDRLEQRITDRWISIDEKLPEEEVDVLICNEFGDIEISRGSYSSEIKDYWIWYVSSWRFGKVEAWMPLPKKYKKQKVR